MKKTLKALLTCFALTATIGMFSGCDTIKQYLPELPFDLPFLGTSSESETDSDTTPNDSDVTPDDSSVAQPKTYTVTFVAGSETVGTVTYKEGADKVTEPTVPAKDHYTGAWESYELDGNVTVNAVYTAVEYTITFVANGATVDTVTYTVEDETIEAPAVPAKDHYTGAWESYELDGGNKTVNATYTANEYTITFVADGETVGTVPYTVADEAIEEPTIPAKEGYGAKWESYTLDGGDKTVNAIYTAGVYTVTFKADGKTVGTAEYTVENREITEPTAPAKDHYTVVWEAYTLDKGDLTVNAVYTAVEYKVTFVAGEETVATDTYTVEDKEISVPDAPAKDHYTVAWESYELNGGNKTVNAVYTAVEYKVTFVAGEETVATETYTVEDKEISVPTAPEKAHYTVAWESYELNGGDKTVNAVYTAVEYKVTFVVGETTLATDTYTVENTEISVPDVPAKDYYDGAWESYVLDGGDKTVNAVYTATEYTVTFVAEGKTAGTATYTVENVGITAPEVPAKTGYTGVWEEYALDHGDKTVNAIYTANTYTVKFVANGGEISDASDITVTYDAAYALPTATAPKSYQEFLGWADEQGNTVKSAVWNIASNVTLTAVYSEGVAFDTLSEVPSYMEKADNTESLSLVEMNGGKVLQIKVNDDGSGTANRSPALKVTLDFLTQFFSDENVDYVAFDAKAGTTTINNFRRVTLRSDGTFAADCYEHDMTFTHPVDGATYPTTGIRADSWKTFYFSRADYNAWVAQGVTSERFIAAGQFNQGDSIYVDNIRPVTAEERAAGIYSFESGGVRVNDEGGVTLLFYTLDKGGEWQFNMQASSGFTNVGYTNENVTDGIRALQFTKGAGTLNINFPSNKGSYADVVTKTGYYAVDIYIPATSDMTMSYHLTTWAGVTLKKGAWSTIYVQGNNQISLTDTTGGTYLVDNIRAITEEEYNLGGFSFEANASGLRTKELGDSTAHSGTVYYYGGVDHKANTFSFAFVEGNGEGDVDAIQNVRYENTIVHSGAQSLALEKGVGYMFLTMRTDSTAYSMLKNGFTFWVYSTVAIDSVNTINFINGCNEKFNGGEGVYIPANTWTQITVNAEDINAGGRFLIIQGGGATAGTIYFDDFQPLA